MRFRLSIIFILSYGSLWAKPDVLDYYRKVNLAELAICDSNFKEANKYFTEAFAINPQKSFSRDLCNAFFSAMDTREYSYAEKYLSQLLSRGIGSDFIRDRMLKYYIGEPLKRMQAMLAKYPNDTVKYDTVVARIDKMLNWDQDVRYHYGALNDGAYMVDSTFKVDSINAQELLKLFGEGGVFNETVLGNSQLFGFSPFAGPGYNILIWHNTGAAMGGRPSHLFDTMLFKAIFSFDYDARKFAGMVQVNALSPIFKSDGTILNFPLLIGGFEYNKRIYPEYWDEASEKRMNEDRAKIGLESLGDLRRKIETANMAGSGNSVLSKYNFVVDILVQLGETEEALTKWLATNGKDAVIKRSVFANKPHMPKAQSFDIGVLGDTEERFSYVIGKTRFNDRMEWWANTDKELKYYLGSIPYRNRKSRQSLPWNYHAELIKNTTKDVSTDTEKYNQARFVPGYKILIEHSATFWFGRFKHTELVFDDNALISFTAEVDTVFYKVMTRHFGNPVYSEKRDTASWAKNRNYIMILKNRTYSWQKGRKKVEIKLSEGLNEKGLKYTSAEYQMTDTVRYTAYLEKVEVEKKKLDGK